MDVLDHEGASDTRLAAAAGSGDDEAFAVLYVRYAPRIEAYLQRLLDDRHLAQDLTQEVFVSALNRLRSARPPIAVGPWLYRIARNASIDVHRRSQLVRQVPLPSPDEENGTLTWRHEPQTQAELRQWLDDLRDLLGGLSDSHRSVLVLRELEGLSNGEIAERLGLSRPAVEGLLFRARAKMRSEYEDLTSGRRCARVQAAVDRAGGGEQLGRRDLALATRHLTGCAQCRSHAWEAGVTDMLAPVANGRRRAWLPAPLVGLFGRLSSDHAPLLAAPWGRAAAAVTAVVVAGGAVAPRVHHAATATARPTPLAQRTASAAPTALATVAAPRVPSPAAVATALPRPVAAVAPRRRASSAPAAPAAAPAPANPSETATVRPEAARPAPGAAPGAAPVPRVPAAPERPAPTATAARTRETVGSATAPLVDSTPAPVADPVSHATAEVGRATEQAAATVEHTLPALDVAPVVSDPVEVLAAPAPPAVEGQAAPAVPTVGPVAPALG